MRTQGWKLFGIGFGVYYKEKLSNCQSYSEVGVDIPKKDIQIGDQASPGCVFRPSDLCEAF